MHKKQALYAALGWLPATGIPALARARYGGIGTIFTLHSVVRDRKPSYAFMRDMDLSEAFLESVLKDYLARGYHIASMDEVRSYLDEPARRPERFVAFTLDDGYRNNLEVALPLFERYRAPFAIYVATDMIDGKRLPWEYGLQDLVRSQRALAADLGDGVSTLRLDTGPERAHVFDVIAAHVHGLAESVREPWLTAFFEANDVDPAELTARHMLSWDMLRQLAASPYVTIGSHGVSHVPLRALDDARLCREIDGARARLEEELKLPVRHFAYPYGGYDQVGRREIDTVAASGYRTAVTTRGANVFAGHAEANAPCALPRQPLSGVVEDIRIVRVLDSGLPAALSYGLRRVVTDQGGLKRYL